MRDIVLVVDDVALNRTILSDMLKDEYRIVEAADGMAALEAMQRYGDEIAVVLLDLVMPEFDGFSVLEAMVERRLIEHFPVLIITGENSYEAEARCLSLGAADFIKKPFNPALVCHRVRNAASLYTYKFRLEEQVAAQTVQLREQAEALRISNHQLREMNERTIELLSDVIEARNLESGTHVHRVRSYTRILGRRLMETCPEYGLTEETVNIIALASSMHDVGKIMISDAILLKPGKLTEEEFELMKRHTVLGCEVLARTKYIWEADYYEYCRQICRHHHEKWDGRGYPDRLAGDDIPISAQLVSVADVYDALTNERVYKKAYSPEEAYRMILGGECGQFNPKLIGCFVDCHDGFAAQVALAPAPDSSKEALK